MERYNCTCHCGGSMFYKHLHDPSCDLFMHGEEAPQSKEAQLQAALDAEREKVKRLSTCGTDHSTPWWQVKCEDLEAQLATLQAQLRQVEGDAETYRKMHAVCTMNLALANNDLATLRQLVEALPVCNPTSFQIFEAADGNGYDVHGAIKEPYSVGWIGTFLHKAEAESYIQALTARATLAAQDAGQGGLQ